MAAAARVEPSRAAVNPVRTVRQDCLLRRLVVQVGVLLDGRPLAADVIRPPHSLIEDDVDPPAPNATWADPRDAAHLHRPVEGVLYQSGQRSGDDVFGVSQDSTIPKKTERRVSLSLLPPAQPVVRLGQPEATLARHVGAAGGVASGWGGSEAHVVPALAGVLVAPAHHRWTVHPRVILAVHRKAVLGAVLPRHQVGAGGGEQACGLVA